MSTMDERSRKRPRPGDGEGRVAGGGGDDDRLSALPDCLLHDILSRVKARQVVQTCVLSRQWRHFWRSVPRLDVDCADFWRSAPRLDVDYTDFRRSVPRLDVDLWSPARFQPHPPVVPPGVRNLLCLPQGRTTVEDFGKFEDFVDNLMLRRDAASPLDALCLRIDRHCLDTTYGRWIRRAKDRHAPAVLDFRSDKTTRFILPSLASGCHRLTRLRLESVVLHRDFAERLATGLPVLEDLEIRDSLFGFREIKSATLKNLNVEGCSTTNGDGFVVSAPRLSSLRVDIMPLLSPGGPTVIENTTSLVKASVRYLHPRGRPWQESMHNLLPCLSNVSSLELSDLPGPVTKARRNIYKTMFSNLRNTVLHDCFLLVNDNLKMLWHFLQQTPALDELTLQCCKFSGGSSIIWNHGLALKMPSNLKRVEITYQYPDGQIHNVVSIISSKLPGTTIKVSKVERNEMPYAYIHHY